MLGSGSMRPITTAFRLLYTRMRGSYVACSLKTTYVARRDSNTARVDFIEAPSA